jgi:hypothetical protein
VSSFLTADDLGAQGSVFITSDRVEAEIGVDLRILAQDRDGPLILDIGGVPCVERADLVRFKKLLRLRARHKRLFGTELDDVPPMLRHDWRAPDPVRDQIAADITAQLDRCPTQPAPGAEPAAVLEP